MNVQFRFAFPSDSSMHILDQSAMQYFQISSSSFELKEDEIQNSFFMSVDPFRNSNPEQPMEICENEFSIYESNSSDSDEYEEFLLLTSSHKFLKASELISNNPKRMQDNKFQFLCLVLHRLQLFYSLKERDDQTINYLLEAVKAESDSDTITEYIGVMVDSPEIFLTHFFNSKLNKLYIPSAQLLFKCALFSNFACEENSLTFEEAERILQNIVEEMVFYTINFSKIKRSIGDKAEIYLNFHLSYSADCLSIKSIINKCIEDRRISREKNSKISLDEYKKSSDRTRRVSDKECIFSVFTTTSDETSTGSNTISYEELYKSEFASVKKQVLNQKILRYFKEYLRTYVKQKGSNNYSSFIHDFCQNRFNPPVQIHGQSFSSFNKNYMHWLFSNSQIVCLYNDYIIDTYDYLFDNIVKAYKISCPKELLYMGAYIKQTAYIYSNPPSLNTKCELKKKGMKRIKSNDFNPAGNKSTKTIASENTKDLEEMQIVEFEISNLF